MNEIWLQRRFADRKKRDEAVNWPERLFACPKSAVGLMVRFVLMRVGSLIGGLKAARGAAIGCGGQGKMQKREKRGRH